MTAFWRTHVDFAAKCAKLKSASPHSAPFPATATTTTTSPTAVAVDIFRAHFSALLVAGTGGSGTFSRLEAQALIDFFLQGYAQHARLIATTLATPRQLRITPCARAVGRPVPPVPLAVAVPAERWEEHLAAEADKRRRLEEAELEAILAKERMALEKERLANEAAAAAEAARIKKLNMIVRIPPLSAYHDALPAAEEAAVVARSLLVPPPTTPPNRIQETKEDEMGHDDGAASRGGVQAEDDAAVAREAAVEGRSS
ncbi:hypothetical protein DFJ73DRAFT_962074, partial [Zopfochytrium polystomum]